MQVKIIARRNFMTLQKIVKEYLEHIKYSVKKKTYLFYLQICEIYIAKFNENLSSEKLNTYIIELKEKLSYSTIKTIKSLINRSLKFAFEKNYIDTKMQVEIQLKSKQTKKVQALEKCEQTKIENHILQTHKLYSYGILICLFTGLRLGELVALKWQSVDLKNKIIYIEKAVSTISQNHKIFTIEDTPKTTSSIRVIPISKQLFEILKELKQNISSEYVVCSHNNKKLQPRAYQKSFENLLKKLKIKHYGFHSLRHTFATRLLENKVDIKTISELMGHSSPTITLNRYVHTNLQNKRKAMEIFNKNKR